MDQAYAAELIDLMARAKALHNRTPSNEDAPGLKAQVQGAVTFLTGAAGAMKAQAPDAYEAAMKDREFAANSI